MKESKEKTKGINVTVAVPVDQYKLLTMLKEKTGRSIKSIAGEGIRLAILEHANLFEREKVLRELDDIEHTLAKLKKSKE